MSLVLSPSSAPGLLPVGLSFPQSFSKPFSSLFDHSKFSEANGALSLQVSDDFTSLSSLLNPL